MGLELGCERGRKVEVDDVKGGDSVWREGDFEEINLIRGRKREGLRNFERSGGWRVLKNIVELDSYEGHIWWVIRVWALLR